MSDNTKSGAQLRISEITLEFYRIPVLYMIYSTSLELRVSVVAILCPKFGLILLRNNGVARVSYCYKGNVHIS